MDPDNYYLSPHDKLYKKVSSFGIIKEEANYLKKPKCFGDYCAISDDFSEL